jgi:Ca-activated chloride channel family protein
LRCRTAGNTTQQDFQLVRQQLLDMPQIVYRRELSSAEVGPEGYYSAGAEQIPGVVAKGGTSLAGPRKKPMALTASRKETIWGVGGLREAILLWHPMSTGGSVPPNGQDYDAMFFKHYGVNPFISTDDDHLSTFAIDADNASYSMTRSYLTRGSLPPDEAVRVEEFVNNFKYEYRHPQNGHFICLEGAPLSSAASINCSKSACWQEDDECRRQDAICIRDRRVRIDGGKPSGRGQESAHLLVDNLTDRDRVGIVAYRTEAFEVLAPTSFATETNHQRDR